MSHNIIPMTGSLTKSNTNQTSSFFDDFFGVAIEYGSDFTPISIMGFFEELTGYSELELISGKNSWKDLPFPQSAGFLARNFRPRPTPHIGRHTQPK